MPECQQIKKVGLDQYGAERFGRLILPQSEKCGTKRVKAAFELPGGYSSLYELYDEGEC